MNFLEVFDVIGSYTVTISGLTIEDGNSLLGGGIDNDGGNVTVTDSTLSGNSATPLEGNGFAFGGGIVSDFGTLTVTDSTLSGNSVSTPGCTSSCLAGGGGIYQEGGTVTITDSTLSGNSASSTSGCTSDCVVEGGGVFNNGGTLTVTNSTLSGNSASTSGCTNICEAEGGGIHDDGAEIIGATIVANSTGGNCDSPVTTDLGYNLEDDAGASCGFSSADYDVVGQNPDLGPLQGNGGPTQTMALQTGSPAIGLVNSATLCASPDQRGSTRPSPFCDSGAYETTPPPCPAPVITGTTAVVTCSYVGTTAQTWTGPAGVNQATFDVFGAQGGIGIGGLGGETKETLAGISGTTFSVVVAGQGGTTSCFGGTGAGGFGGGGEGGFGACSGGGGGGGSWVSDAGFHLLIAGGGGGGADCFSLYNASGGAGGGLSGTQGQAAGLSQSFSGGAPGTQSGGGVATFAGGSGGSGQGGAGATSPGSCEDGSGGGGGGYFGGAGGENSTGGGGGSGFAAAPLAAIFNTGVQSGNGVVTFTYTLPASTSATSVTVTPSGSTALGDGGTLSDTLTVTGVSGGPTPTNAAGGVAFYVCQVSTSSTLAPGVCPATGAPFDATEILSGSGDTATATSNPFTPTSTGTWCFSATYGGDADYAGSADNTTEGNADANECVLIGPASPSITTTPSATSITLGPTPPTLKDTAVLSGGYEPTGTITFTLHNPGGTLVDTETVTVSGNGSYTTPTGYTLPTTGTDTGTYQWDASYTSGNANNSNASENNATAEQVKVISPCGSLTAYFLSATSTTGSFTGLFCVNASGSGTYSQNGGATVTGQVLTSGATTWISASGTKLALLGEKSSTINTFTETAPVPMKTGTFALSPLP